MEPDRIPTHPPILGPSAQNHMSASMMSHIDPVRPTNRNLRELQEGFTGDLSALQRAMHSFLSSDELIASIKDRIERGKSCVDIDLLTLHNSPDDSHRMLYTTLLTTPDVFQVFDLVLHQVALSIVVQMRDEHLKRLWDENPNISRDVFLSSTQYKNAISYYSRVANNLHLRCYPVNFPEDDSQSLRTLGPMHADSLISVSGMVSNISSRVPEMVEACFQCTVCKDVKKASVKRGKIISPIQCTNCDSLQSIEIVHNMCTFIDKRVIKIQEAPDQLTSGTPPISCSFVAYDLDLSGIRPGDRVVVVGIYRLRQTRPKQSQAVCNAALRPVIELLSIFISDSAATDSYLSAKKDSDVTDYERLKSLDPNTSYAEYYNHVTRLFPDMIPETDSGSDKRFLKLINSIAPSIFGPAYSDIKTGLLLQCFGGVQKDSYRGQIHVLLVGDPGLAKSKLLQYVAKISPRSVYTSGKGSSQAGLTATVSRHPETHEFYLDPGALLLSDGGICCLDEFDKSSEDVRSSLHEVMEHGQLSIAKAGILATLSAKTSILAAANPIDSCYNPKRTVVQNLNLPPSLLSRFDLIYLLLDNRHDTEADRALASWLVSMYISSGQAEHSGHLSSKNTAAATPDAWDPQVLRQYIYFAQKLSPVLSKSAQDALLLSYNQLRSGSYSASGRITATPRQLMSLIRLAEARARIRFSNFVTANDILEVSRLMTRAMHLAMTDQSGFINMDIFAETGGTSEAASLDMLCRAIIRYKSQRIAELQSVENEEQLTVTVLELLANMNRGLSTDQISTGESVSSELLNTALDTLVSQGLIVRNGDDVIFI
ncbi:DNA replication licensing factor MCM4 [Giardia duodenalis]|uniref:DNA replication licensing factor MCM4 n=1 Tax=Giardia intestinalis (strain ATCC 50803 / WB clone C6) TaxID=184922 RepID=A8B7S5_GIAIC|nr:DNA replication licensing factor MCM4 [Giardia intestinalis]KAE8305402.1 DNA replication licensing factor MCM4 [Giardia intestinalis]|eukprot:XP_001708871.1 MCM4 [Giardia lamblia ATCC 50803]